MSKNNDYSNNGNIVGKHELTLLSVDNKNNTGKKVNLKSNKSLFIFRRDYRTYDNTAFQKCLKHSDSVYPIFIFTPEQVIDNEFKSSNAIQFMVLSLKDLKENQKLKELTLFQGNYTDIISHILKHTDIDSIYSNTDYTPYAIKRDIDIQELCDERNINLFLYHDITLLPPKSVKNLSGNIYQKFTPFYELCLSKQIPNLIRSHNLEPCKSLSRYKELKKYIIGFDETNKYYTFNSNIAVEAGRTEGLKILNSIQKFKDYDKTHNMLFLETTQLSAYLKFGCLSIREVYFTLLKKFGKNDPIIRQLFWRDFYYHIGNGFINSFGNALKPKYDKIKWVKNKKNLECWKKGETGYPVVDACMKQINTSGYMHNRGRLIVASFLVKNLGIDWREGEKYFAQSLVDYDVFVNNGNWQWVAGSGADSQPYFRIFNPSLQSHKHDPECKYIKKWLPNLSKIDAKDLHNWEENYKKYDLKDIKYFKPIINYKESKEKILKMYKKAF
jgi:deoxyribodipyrimidine photo-lyase